MDIRRTATVLVALMVVFSVGAFAAPIVVNVNSHGSASNTPGDSVTSNAGPVVYEIIPNGGWYTPSPTNAKWVSSWMSGNPNLPGYFQVPNGTVQTISHNFMLPNMVIDSVYVKALLMDDTGWLGVNTHFVTAPTSLVPGPACVTGPPGCVLSTLWQGSVDKTWLTPGAMNNLFIGVTQLYGSSTGGFYEMTVTGHSPVPEPATYGMMGLGLAAVGLISRRRKTATIKTE